MSLHSQNPAFTECSESLCDFKKKKEAGKNKKGKNQALTRRETPLKG